MNDQDHSLSLSDPDRSLVLSHLLVNFLKNLVSCQTSFRRLTLFLQIKKGILLLTVINTKKSVKETISNCYDNLIIFFRVIYFDTLHCRI
jgi:hypothetical protein